MKYENRGNEIIKIENGVEKEAIIDNLPEEVSFAFEERPDNGTTRWDCDELDAINRIREILGKNHDRIYPYWMHFMSDNVYRVVAISRKTQKRVIAYMGSGAIEATDAFELLKNNEGFMNTFRVRLERLEPVIVDEARKLS